MILVAGSANLDFVVRAQHIPRPGETVLGLDFRTYPGGKGANQAVACARAGGAGTQMVLAVGRDAHAETLLNSLNHAQVHVHLIACKSLPTGCAFICVADNAENAITVAPGANLALLPEHLPPLDGISHLLMQLETPLDTVAAFAESAHARGVKVVLNAAPARALSATLLQQVDVLVVNEGELAAQAGSDGTLAEQLRRLSVPTVVVTLGARGCVARQGETFFVTPSYPVDAADTTGAGDTFCGVLVAALDRGLDLPQAMARASAAAALACTCAGAQSSIPQSSQVDALLHARSQPSNDALLALQAYCGLTQDA